MFFLKTVKIDQVPQNLTVVEPQTIKVDFPNLRAGEIVHGVFILK